MSGILLGAAIGMAASGEVFAQSEPPATVASEVAASGPDGAPNGIRREEPEWLSKTGGGGQPAKTASYRRSTLRSIGSLLLLIGLMLGANHWLRRRMAVQRASGNVQGPKLKARLRVGMRQEVVVVEWEGEELVLGVGPTFIQRLHVRKATGSEPAALAEMEGAVHAG